MTIQELADKMANLQSGQNVLALWLCGLTLLGFFYVLFHHHK
jgi:hypothetical protein